MSFLLFFAVAVLIGVLSIVAVSRAEEQKLDESLERSLGLGREKAEGQSFEERVPTLPLELDPKKKNRRYRTHAALLTKTEASFFEALQSALGGGYYLFSKVRLTDVLNPTETGQPWRQAYSQICSKHLDFLICRAHSWEFIAAVELDDASHRHRDRMERDEFIEQALAHAALPLIRIPARRAFAADELREIITPVLEGTAPVQTPSPSAEPTANLMAA